MSGPVSALVPALLAGLAALLLVRSPAQQVTRAATVAVEDDAASRWAALHSWLQGRPDAPPLSRRVAVSLAGAAALGLALHRFNGALSLLAWGLAPLLVPLGVVLLGRLEPRRSRRRRERVQADLPHALELMSACLAAGMPLRAATTAVAACFEGPLTDDLHQVLALVALGASDADAWRALRKSPEWRPTVVDLARSVESGTMMVEVLLHHAQDARHLRRAAIEVRAKAVGVRSVLPLMVCFLPAFLLVGVVPTVASALLRALP